eukprot:281733-Pyramimonas_sp.AAC.1
MASTGANPPPAVQGLAGTAGGGDGANPTGEARGLGGVELALTTVLEPANYAAGNGWECGICADNFCAGSHGGFPTFGCASCGTGMCPGCSVAAYAMTGAQSGYAHFPPTTHA